MAVIKAKEDRKIEKVRLDIEQGILHDVKAYCEWVGISDISHFFEEAALFVFQKDSDWKKHLKQMKKSNKTEEA